MHTQIRHKCIKNTMVYTQRISFESDECHLAHAKILKEDKLTQAGFKFVRYNESGQVAIYRKEK